METTKENQKLIVSYDISEDNDITALTMRRGDLIVDLYYGKEAENIIEAIKNARLVGYEEGLKYGEALAYAKRNITI